MAQCPVHHVDFTLRPAGVSKAGKHYNSFYCCSERNPDGSFCQQKPPKPARPSPAQVQEDIETLFGPDPEDHITQYATPKTVQRVDETTKDIRWQVCLKAAAMSCPRTGEGITSDQLAIWLVELANKIYDKKYNQPF